MSCYRPNFMIPIGLNENGKKKFKFLSYGDVKRNTCINSDGKIIEVVNYDYLREHYPDFVQVPCGRCIGCRLDYSRSWADRMMLELESFDGKAIFATLTYDNDHIHWSQFDDADHPLFGTLDKRDCQLFMKRLRDRFTGVRISYYLAGEYGPSTLRPHYHAILFGLTVDDLADRNLDSFGKNELGQCYFKSDVLKEIWQNGNVLISDVSWKTCAYVSRYVTKKLYGAWSIDYAVRNVEPEFSLMSKNPAIGLTYLRDHPECLDLQYLNISTEEGGRKIPLPKYFIRKLDSPGTEKFPNLLYDPEKYANMKQARKEFASDQMLIKLSKTSLSALDYLENEERKKLKSIKSLKRNKL